MNPRAEAVGVYTIQYFSRFALWPLHRQLFNPTGVQQICWTDITAHDHIHMYVTHPAFTVDVLLFQCLITASGFQTKEIPVISHVLTEALSDWRVDRWLLKSIGLLKLQLSGEQSWLSRLPKLPSQIRLTGRRGYRVTVSRELRFSLNILTWAKWLPQRERVMWPSRKIQLESLKFLETDLKSKRDVSHSVKCKNLGKSF